MDFKLDLLKLKSEKLQKVGEWSALNGLVITDKYAFTEGRPPNITLRVLSRIEEPFVMFRKVSCHLLRQHISDCSLDRTR